MWIRTAFWLVASLLATGSLWAQARSTARLLIDSREVTPGGSFVAAIELTAPPEWHTYWRNSGDSGQRTKIDWTLPAGVTASEILWPAPRRLTEAGLTTYVYDGKVILPVRMSVASTRAPGPVTLEAKVSWLECKTECIPGRTNVSAPLLIGSKPEVSSDAAIIQQTITNLPAPDPAISASAEWAGPAVGDVRSLLVRSTIPGFTDFFPYEQADTEVARSVDSSPERGIGFALTKSGAAWPTEFAGLVRIVVPGGADRFATVSLPISEGSKQAGNSSMAGPITSDAKPSGLLVMLGLAFLGGLILNIMPCVLPVIALKVLGFVKQSREDPRRVRYLGLVYTLGVLVSFAVLAGLMIAVQSGGKNASWGMQFQNPIFLVAITTLVTLVALNLFGVFEVNLAPSAMGKASQLASKEGVNGAFFNGVFTTVLATPCTAPFLGVAIGFAVGQPPFLLLLTFLVAGLGLATPYLLLSIQPGWLKFLPKPGNWMVTFKMWMGFPMLATAVWLLSLAPSYFGDKGMFWLGMFLVLVSLAVWVFGHSIQFGSGSRRWSWGAVIAVVLAGIFILERELQWRSPVASDGTSTVTTAGGITWNRWSPEAVAAARSEGRPVLVDFTAGWCATCQLNKKIAIEVPEVVSQLRAMNAVTLRGDFTREDPTIAAELRKFGRSAVPMVLVYSKDGSVPPKVLPAALTKGIVLEALSWAAGTEPKLAAGKKWSGR